MAFERLSRTLLLAKPRAVVLSVMIGDAAWGYPISRSVRRVDVAACPLMKSPDISASEAADTTVGMMVLIASTAPLGAVFSGIAHVH